MEVPPDALSDDAVSALSVLSSPASSEAVDSAVLSASVLSAAAPSEDTSVSAVIDAVSGIGSSGTCSIRVNPVSDAAAVFLSDADPPEDASESEEAEEAEAAAT